MQQLLLPAPPPAPHQQILLHDSYSDSKMTGRRRRRSQHVVLVFRNHRIWQKHFPRRKEIFRQTICPLMVKRHTTTQHVNARLRLDGAVGIPAHSAVQAV